MGLKPTEHTSAHPLPLLFLEEESFNFSLFDENFTLWFTQDLYRKSLKSASEYVPHKRENPRINWLCFKFKMG